MIHFGAIGGAKQPIAKLKSMLSGIGPKGSFTLDVPGKSETDLQVMPNVTLRLALPCSIEYTITDKAMTFHFGKPVLAITPIVNKFCDQATIQGLERIDISLRWAPDGYISIDS